MRKLDNTEVKKYILNILCEFAAFCDQNGLRSYLSGGTLLGAVRHKGFIPWDDDIEIAMPREDYIKFQKSYNGYSDRYVVNGIENNEQWQMPFARVEDLDTVLYEHTLKPKYEKCHVFVDVFPIDGIPKNHVAEKFFMLKQNILGILVNASSFCFNPSKHYSDSKSNIVTFRNNVRTFFKYFAIMLFSWVNTQNVI